MMASANRNAILFFARFGGSYIVFSLLYSLFLSRYIPAPDPITWMIGEQLVGLLQVFSDGIVFLHLSDNKVLVNFNDRDVVSIYEGCNGLIVQALFVSFFIGIWQWNKKTLYFIIVGMISVYVLNMTRLTALVFIAQSNQSFFYYYHKYVFTGIMYLSIMAMWYFWLVKSKSVVKQ